MKLNDNDRRRTFALQWLDKCLLSKTANDGTYGDVRVIVKIKEGRIDLVEVNDGTIYK